LTTELGSLQGPKKKRKKLEWKDDRFENMESNGISHLLILCEAWTVSKENMGRPFGP